MFRWLSKGRTGHPIGGDAPAAELPRLTSAAELERAAAEPVTILFKHSPACSVSWAAHRQVKRFLAETPGAPLHLILVRDDYEVSQLIARKTGIAHASPQIIVLRNGEAVANASHERVTADNLKQMLRVAR